MTIRDEIAKLAPYANTNGRTYRGDTDPDVEETIEEESQE